MNAKLVGVLMDVRGGMATVSAAAEQIAAGNTSLSQRTEEQAASLEETAASMEQLTATVRQNADNAQAAAELAASASTVAAEGRAAVDNVVTTMSEISASSKRIGDIIAVIDGIAFQTNILALNAAVEAARAGEQGRGFAVVAGEVRSLAQRSAAAAKEIKALIEDSTAKVAAGSHLVDTAGRTIGDVVGTVERMDELMSAITAASAEQTAGIEQVNSAVSQMDRATQQNAALVEQLAKAASGLATQTRIVDEAMGAFRFGNDVARGSPGALSRREAASGAKGATRAAQASANERLAA
jgi:methyl-accepting chemotaxis protein